MLFVRELQPDERAALERAAQDNTIDWAQRARIILLSASGKTVPEISTAVGLHPINVRKWIHRYNARGIAGLQSGKSPGRPPVFTEEQRNKIIELYNTSPRDAGQNFDRWSLQRLREYLINHQFVDSISAETVRQILLD